MSYQPQCEFDYASISPVSNIGNGMSLIAAYHQAVNDLILPFCRRLDENDMREQAANDIRTLIQYVIEAGHVSTLKVSKTYVNVVT